MIPFFLRDFTCLFDDLDVKHFPSNYKIMDSDTISNKFYVIKKGRVKVEDLREEKQKKKDVSETEHIKIEGEWFGYESLIEKEHPQRSKQAMSNKEHFVRECRYRITTLEHCEVIVGSLELL